LSQARATLHCERKRQILSQVESLRASESPVIRKATSALLALTLVAGAVIIDSVFAQFYFYSNWIRLENAADAAANAGAVFLPANPAMALKTAHEYASLNGVRPSEIVSATIAPDDSAITIRLKRAMPFYLLCGGGISHPSGPVTATDQAHAPRTSLAHSRPFAL
jgi:hypothetical protein